MPHAKWISVERPRFVGEPAGEGTNAPPSPLGCTEILRYAPSSVPARSEEHVEGVPAPRSAHKTSLHLWWVYAFLIGLVLPIETSVFIGPLRLAPYRVVLIVFLVPGMIMLFSGRAGQLRAADGFIAAHALWAALALLINNGVGGGLEPAGIYVIEVMGSYLIGRCCIRSAEDFRRAVRILFWLVAILLPFALFESVTGNAIIRNLFRAIAGGGPMGYGEQRLGLTRAFASFEHPILYGVFCATNFSLVFYALRDASWQRGLRAIVIVAATFFALSSAPLLALVIQILLISWDFTTRRMPYHWIALTSMIAAAYIAVDIVSTRSPILVFVSRLTFNAETGYFRTYIWNYGIANVWQNPLFGIGENDWVRPEWMPPSVDNFWLLTAMRYGIPAFIFLVMAIALMLYSLSRMRITSPTNADMRKGLLITFFALMFAATTVHLWTATFTFFFFLVGTGYGLSPARKSG